MSHAIAKSDSGTFVICQHCTARLVHFVISHVCCGWPGARQAEARFRAALGGERVEVSVNLVPVLLSCLTSSVTPVGGVATAYTRHCLAFPRYDVDLLTEAHCRTLFW